MTEQEKEHRYGNLGTVFRSLGEYVKAKEYYEKALAISMEIGNREGEGTSYGNLGMCFVLSGEYVKAKEYYEKALAISMEIGRQTRRRNMVWKPRNCVSFSLVNMSRLKNIMKKHLRSAWKLETEQKKEHCMET